MKKKIYWIVISVLSILAYIWMIVLGNDFFQPSIASKILRFHVLANSDTEADQTVKLEVRDAVGTYLQPLLNNTENLEETKKIVEKNIPEIIEIAKETLEKNGYYYPVTAIITKTDFPEKTYGSYTFPKGEYEALQIIIGEGAGQNWWCVLYPNMCFKGTVYEVVEEDAKEALREVLSPWEYADVFDSGKVKVRFKLLELFKERG